MMAIIVIAIVALGFGYREKALRTAKPAVSTQSSANSLTIKPQIFCGESKPSKKTGTVIMRGRL